MSEEKEKNSEFQEKETLLRLEGVLVDFKHKYKMEELEFERATLKLNHELILERGRISRAEERKMLLEKVKLQRAV